jgi:Ca2+-binding RTX toxin-like protein
MRYDVRRHMVNNLLENDERKGSGSLDPQESHKVVEAVSRAAENSLLSGLRAESRTGTQQAPSSGPQDEEIGDPTRKRLTDPESGPIQQREITQPSFADIVAFATDELARSEQRTGGGFAATHGRSSESAISNSNSELFPERDFGFDTRTKSTSVRHHDVLGGEQPSWPHHVESLDTESSHGVQSQLEPGVDGLPPPNSNGPNRSPGLGGPGAPGAPGANAGGGLPGRTPNDPQEDEPENPSQKLFNQMNANIARGEKEFNTGVGLSAAGGDLIIPKPGQPAPVILRNVIIGSAIAVIGERLMESGLGLIRDSRKIQDELNKNWGDPRFDPIFVDLDSDGLDLAAFAVAFDLDNDGFAERTAWSSSDALLVRDIDQDGYIDQGEEISFAADGSLTDLEGLSVHDLNEDGVIDDLDPIFEEILLWLDANADGFSDEAELATLSEAGIVAIDLTPTPVDPESEGVVYWHDANSDGLVDPAELFESAEEAPPGAIAGQIVEGGIVFQTGSITTTTGTLPMFAVALEFDPLGVQTETTDDEIAIQFENGASELWHVVTDPNGVTLDLASTAYDGVFGAEGDDTITMSGSRNVFLFGGEGDDTVIGGDGDDILYGGEGADEIDGGEGNDVIFFDVDDFGAGVSGGGGYDRAHAISTDAISLNLGNREIESVAGNEGNDTFVAGDALDVEIFGGAGDDEIVGGSGNDQLHGGVGNDSLSGGAGDDIIWFDAADSVVDGGAGFDFAAFLGETGISFDLASNSIEAIVGGAGNDTFTTSGSTAIIVDGRDGDDTLQGGSGDDRLIGGLGDDSLDGGDGLDAAWFAGQAADYQVTGDENNATVTDMVSEDGDDGADTLENVERLVFSDATIHLDGINNAPIVNDEIWRLRSDEAGSLLTAVSLLANDWDFDLDYLQIEAIGSVDNAEITIKSNGDILFEALDGEAGVASFDYYISDGQGGSAIANSTVEIFQALPDDDLFAYQWGLNWLNLYRVWDDYAGLGIEVAVHDNGVDQTHSDIAPNYDAGIDENPGVGAHGTFVTAVVGGARGNGGVVGVAYNATLAVYTQPSLFDWSFAGLEDFDVVNNSWSQSLDTLYVGGAGTLVSGSLEILAEEGRSGLGTISVFTAGNERELGDSANYFDGANSRYSVTVAATKLDGSFAEYSNPGAAILVSAPGSQVVSADITGSSGFSNSSYVLGADYATASGTSASAPFVSGVIALMLEANPNLGWRDVQEILAYSAWNSDPAHGGWTINGATNSNGGGLYVSHDYGFGHVDALAAVRLAETWQQTRTSSNEVTATGSHAPSVSIPDNGSVSDVITIASDIEIDHVEVTVDIDHTLRGDLVIELTSPDGTTSVLMNRPGKDPNDPNDRGSTGDDVAWRFYTTHHWGESSAGDWTLTVRDLVTGEIGMLNSWSIKFHGDTPSNDDTYIYTYDFGKFITGADADRRVLEDSSGHDILNASAIFTNSSVDLRPGSTSELAGNTLTIAPGTTIEDAYLGDGDDTVLGNDADNSIFAGRGNDLLEGGEGDDELDGGAGSDTASYAGSAAAVEVDLAAETSSGGDAAGDTLTSIENLVGSGFDDALTGDAAENALRGGDGDDELAGGAGADMLAGEAGDDELDGGDGDDVMLGGVGNDIIEGGAGQDTAYYVGELADYLVTDNTTHFSVSGIEGTDTLTGIEFLQFRDQRIYLGSNAAPIAANHSVTLTQLLPFVLSEGDLLDDATDANSDPLSLSAVYRSANGAVTLTNSNDVRFLVDADFVGTATFDYSVEDGKAGESIGTVSLTVAPTFTFNGTAGVDLFLGLGSADTVYGNGGSDDLDGGYGDDLLDGGDDADLLHGAHGDDELLGGGGDDTVIGGAGADTIDGGAGLDTADYSDSTETVSVDLLAGSGNGGDAEGDTLTSIENVVGGSGNDDLKGDSEVNALFGESGNDLLQGEGDDDDLHGGGGDDVLVGGAGADTLSGEDGNDSLRGGAGADQLDGGSGFDLVSYIDAAQAVEVDLATGTHTGDASGDVFVAIEGVEGSNFADELTGSSSADWLIGAGGNDVIFGGSGDDVLLGGLGDDTVTGFNGADTLEGGAGDDFLTGRSDVDTYVYTDGDGHDVILEDSSNNSYDALVLHEIGTADVTLERSTTDTADLELLFASGGSITLDGQFGSGGWHRVEEIIFDDGTVWQMLDMLAFLGAGETTTHLGTAAAETINGTSANDVIEGLGGNDTLVGANGSDAYVYQTGDGNDLIDDAGNIAFDELRLQDLNPEDVTLTRSGDQLYIDINSTGARITDNEHFDAEFRGLEAIEFADGTVWDRPAIQANAWFRGTGGADTLTGTSEADTFEGGGGDDTITGGYGGDTYLFAAGSGNDEIIDYTAYSEDTDTLKLVDLDASDISLIRSGSHLFIKVIATGEQIKVADHFGVSSGVYGIERLIFANGTVWGRDQILAAAWILGTSASETVNGSGDADNIDGLGGADTLQGGSGGDTYLYGAGSGNDTVVEGSIDSTTDKVKLDDLNLSDVTLHRSGNHLFVTINATGEQLKVQDHFYSTSYGIEQLVFADGTIWVRNQILGAAWIRGTGAGETITGTSDPDTIDGLGGNDTLNGSGGNDTYIYRVGSGNDVIAENTGSADTDKVKLDGLNVADVTLHRSGYHLFVTINSSGEQLKVQDQFYSTTFGVEQLEFADGTIWDRSQILGAAWIRGTAAGETITGTSDPDTIDGLGGNDTLNGTGGNDIYMYRVGSGNDVIAETTDGAATDKVKLDGLNVSDVSLHRSGYHLFVTINSTGEQLKVQDQFYSTTYGIEQLEFANGTIWDQNQIQAAAWILGTSSGETINGTSGVDAIDGLGGNDTISGSGGGDIIVGGAGNDTLTGGAGNDTFIFKTGFGQDAVTDFVAGAASDDVVEFRDGLFADVNAILAAASTSGNNTIITVDQQNTITLQNVALANLHQDDFRVV